MDMPSPPGSCARCGTPLDSLTLNGLCPRCVAMDFFATPPAEQTDAAGPVAIAVDERRVGDYELIEEIARGGMGVVYRARQVSLGREVAVKMLLHGMLAGDTAIARFKAEAAAVASLRHPHIVAVHEIGEHQGRHFFSMEFVTGRTLAEKVREGPLPVKQAATYLQRVAEAVQYAHERGVLHRDLKPSNVLVDENDQPRVTDFGLSKRAGTDMELTMTGQVLGTPAYMSPEQAGGAGLGPVDARSDVYSLGAILYHLITGRPPFTGETVTEILRQVTEIEPVAPRLLNPALPRDLETICLKCLVKEPAGRYPTAQALADDLGRFLSQETIAARPAGAAEKLWRWCRRKPALATALCACAVILVAGITGILWQLRQTETARQDAVQKAKEETTQRQLADRARAQAQESALVTRQNLYAADMLGAQRAIEQTDLGGAKALLDAYRPKAGEADLRGFEWRFFWRQVRGDSFAVLARFDHELTALAYSADGKWLAFGSLDAVVVDAKTFVEQARVNTGHGVESLVFSPDANALYIGTRESPVMRWYWQTNHAAESLVDTHGQWPKVRLSAAGDIMAAGCDTDRQGGRDGTTQIFEATTGKLIHRLPEAGGCLALSIDGKFLATGSWSNSVKLWDVAQAKVVGILTNTPKVVFLALSPDNRMLAVCDNTREDGLWLYDLPSGSRRRFATGHDRTIWCAAFSPDGKFLATGSSDQTVRQWDVASGRELARFHGHSYIVGQVGWSPDGRVIASGGNDGTLRLWHAVDAPAANTAVSRSDGSSAISFAGDLKLPGQAFNGNILAAADSGGHPLLLKLPGMKPAATANPTGLSLGFSQQGKVFSTLEEIADRDSPWAVVRWSAPDFKRLEEYRLPSCPHQLASPTISQDGLHLAADAGNGNVLVWQLGNRTEPLRLFMENTNELKALAWSPDANLLAAAFSGYDFKATYIHLWDLSGSPMRRVLRGPIPTVATMLFSKDGTRIYCAYTDRQICVWDVDRGKVIGALVGHPVGISALALSPDGRTLASAGNSDSVRLWNLATCREVAHFPLSSREIVSSLAFNPDGSGLLGIMSTVGTPGTTILDWAAPGFTETDAADVP